MLFGPSCLTKVTGTQPGGYDFTADGAHARATLEQYLSTRAMGEHEKSTTFLTKNFLKKFGDKYGVDYVEYHRTDEAIFKAPKIVELVERGDGTIFAKVSVTVEGEGYRERALEQYHMVREGDKWKINDWQIEYTGEAEEWPFKNE